MKPLNLYLSTGLQVYRIDPECTKVRPLVAISMKPQNVHPSVFNVLMLSKCA